MKNEIIIDIQLKENRFIEWDSIDQMRRFYNSIITDLKFKGCIFWYGCLE